MAIARHAQSAVTAVLSAFTMPRNITASLSSARIQEALGTTASAVVYARGRIGSLRCRGGYVQGFSIRCHPHRITPFCELGRLTADAVVETDCGMMWRVHSSKTGKSRKIPVRSEVAELTRELLGKLPSGRPVFGNRNGDRWRRGAGGKHFREVRKSLGWENDPRRRTYSCYTARTPSGIGCSSAFGMAVSAVPSRRSPN